MQHTTRECYRIRPYGAPEESSIEYQQFTVDYRSLADPPNDMPAKKKPITLDFETALKELDQIVARMENNDLSLEEMLKDYERGTALSKICQKSLDAAELRIEKLTRTAKGIQSEPLITNKPSAS